MTVQQPNSDPNSNNAPAPQGGDPAATPETKPADQPAAPTTTPEGGADIAKVLENPELWKQPRIAELLEHSKELKKLKKDQETANETQLTEQKKFEDLATQRGEKITQLETRLQTMSLDQALTAALVKESVIDLDGALKLVDRSKLSVDDNGQVSGVEDALTALKTDKSYLFKEGGNAPTLGAPSNGGTQPNSAPAKFKRSQLQDPAFYKANEKAIDEAWKASLIEDDITPRN